MKIYWDIENRKLLTNSANGQVYQKFDWILRDKMAVSIYIMEPDNDVGGFTLMEAPAGTAIKFGLKLNSGLNAVAAPAYLATQFVWTKNGSGADSYYEGTINLNTTELIDDILLETSKNYIAEFTLQDANGDDRDTTQIIATVKPDVIRGDESDPVSAVSLWPWFEFFTEGGVGKLRIKNEAGETLAIFEPPGV